MEKIVKALEEARENGQSSCEVRDGMKLNFGWSSETHTMELALAPETEEQPTAADHAAVYQAVQTWRAPLAEGLNPPTVHWKKNKE